MSHCQVQINNVFSFGYCGLRACCKVYDVFKPLYC